MIADNLFVVNVDKDLLWMNYLLSLRTKQFDKITIVTLVSLSYITYGKAAREVAKSKAAEKARLTELLAKKQSEKMESMSEDEIRQRLAELE